MQTIKEKIEIKERTCDLFKANLYEIKLKSKKEKGDQGDSPAQLCSPPLH